MNSDLSENLLIGQYLLNILQRFNYAITGTVSKDSSLALHNHNLLCRKKYFALQK